MEKKKRFVFPPNHSKPTLAFLGLVQPWGAIMPIGEMQARWASKIFAKKVVFSSSLFYFIF